MSLMLLVLLVLLLLRRLPFFNVFFKKNQENIMHFLCISDAFLMHFLCTL